MIVIHNQGWLRTKWMPSRTSRKMLEGGGASSLGAAGGVRGNPSRHNADRMNENPSMANAPVMPSSAIAAAPMGGPAMRPNCWLKLESELALGRASVGTSCGTDAAYAGAKNASTKPNNRLMP